MRKKLTSVLVLLCGVAITMPNMQAATLKVATTGQWDGAPVYSTLTEANAVAVSGDEIWVAQATYVADTYMMKSGVNVYGGFVGTETERSQRSQDASLTILRPDATGEQILNGFTTPLTAPTEWDGFTFTGATASGAGGAIRIATQATLRNCIITGNSSNGNGGGIYLQGTAILDRCIVSNNKTLVAAKHGGAIGAQDDALIQSCVIINNEAAGSGGGVFAGNYNVMIKNCLIANNKAGEFGGGAYLGGNKTTTAAAKVFNCTVVNNIAKDGGGISSYTENNRCSNVIFWGNEATATTTANWYMRVPSDLIVSYSAIAGGSVNGGGNIALESTNSGSASGKYYPDFKAPSTTAGVMDGDYGYDFSLGDQSACINKGDVTLFPDWTAQSVDLSGAPRVYGGVIDMGAYENQSIGTAISPIEDITIETFISGNRLHVNGVKGVVTLYDIQGKKVATEVADSHVCFNIRSGIYIVKCGDQIVKVVQ